MPSEYQRIGGSNSETATAIAAAVACGLLYGFFVVKGCLHLPVVVTRQLDGVSSLYLEAFSTAIATSLLLGSLIRFNEKAKHRAEISRRLNSRGAASICVGALLVGIGVAICGTTPGTAWAQSGAMLSAGGYALIGGLVAVVAFGFMHQDVFGPLEQKGQPDKNFLDDILNCQYWHIALPLGSLMAIGIFFMDKALPDDAHYVPGTTLTKDGWVPGYKDTTWSPYIVGCVIGILQIPFRLLLQTGVDEVQGYMTLVALPLNAICKKANTRLPQWFQTHGDTCYSWAIAFLLAVLPGAFFGAYLGDMVRYADVDFGPTIGIIGGFLVVLGSLIAGGGPLGMGVSGVANLSLLDMMGTAVALGMAVATVTLFAATDFHRRDTNFLSN